MIGITNIIESNIPFKTIDWYVVYLLQSFDEASSMGFGIISTCRSSNRTFTRGETVVVYCISINIGGIVEITKYTTLSCISFYLAYSNIDVSAMQRSRIQDLSPISYVHT